jgi:hypothetical protein
MVQIPLMTLDIPPLSPGSFLLRHTSHSGNMRISARKQNSSRGRTCCRGVDYSVSELCRHRDYYCARRCDLASLTPENTASLLTVCQSCALLCECINRRRFDLASKASNIRVTCPSGCFSMASEKEDSPRSSARQMRKFGLLAILLSV